MATPVAPVKEHGAEVRPGRGGERPVERKPVDVGAVGRRVGYAIAIAVNLAVLWVVGNIESWHITRFATDDFDRVLPVVVWSIVVAIAVNVVYLFADRIVIKSLGELVSAIVSLVAVVRVLQVFPFDFSDYAVDWGPFLRVGLIIAIVGTSIEAAVQLAKLVRALAFFPDDLDR